MKKGSVLKILVFVVAVILVAFISFIGIYKYDKGTMTNIMPEYKTGKEFNGSRLITLTVDKSTKEIETTTEEATDENSDEKTEENSEETAEETADENSEKTEEEATEENSEKTQEPVNAPEVLTPENYKLSKDIIENRVKNLKIEEYDIRVNNEDGTISMDMPDSDTIDDALQFLIEPGDFTIIDTETKEVLLGKNDIKTTQIMYNSETKGTRVYLNIQFNKDAESKLEEVTKKYIETKDEDGKTTKKTITIQIDGQEFLTTYFGETISNGQIQIPIGDATVDNTKIQENIKNATYLTNLLNYKTIPVAYTIEQNQYISAVVNSYLVKILVSVCIAVVTLILIFLIVKYKEKGIIGAIALLGYIALFMLIIRYTNVSVTLGGISAIILSTLIEVVFLTQLLKDTSNKKMNESLIKMILIQIPLYLMAIIACLFSYLPIVSFGTTLFWGSIIAIIYNACIVKNILK